MLRPFVSAVLAWRNQLQLLAYQGANIVLAFSAGAAAGAGGDHLLGLPPETLALFPFVALSACIFFFDPVKRPTLLVYAGFAGIAGGACLAAAGLVFNGAAVMLSSLEMARGGRQLLDSTLRYQGPDASRFSRFTGSLVCRATGLDIYARLMGRLSRGCPLLDQSLNQHPLLATMAINGTARFEMILGGLLAGNAVNALIGLSWLLGDVLVGLNDTSFLRFAKRRLGFASGAPGAPAEFELQRS
jgi:hypothetical protein